MDLPWSVDTLLVSLSILVFFAAIHVLDRGPWRK